MTTILETRIAAASSAAEDERGVAKEDSNDWEHGLRSADYLLVVC